MTLQERLSAALDKAMSLSRQRQEVEVQRQSLDAEMLKTAGVIDLLQSMIAEQKEGYDGV